ncbi:MAG: hypothetical protein J6N52_05805 [Clostridia bacterium]|nr:hypothetical protein [Clostridia bacterium]
MRKQFISGIMAAVMAFSCACFSAAAESEVGTKADQGASETFIELPELPSGIAAKVIDITSAEDLISLRESIKSDPNYSVNAVFNLTADIDLGGMEWEPIGYNYDYISDISIPVEDTYPEAYKNSFCGTFNGNGHTISNFTISDPRFKYTGLFGSLNHAVINDLNITGASVLTDTSSIDTEGLISYTHSTLNVGAIDGVGKADIFALYQNPTTGTVYYDSWTSVELPTSIRAILDNDAEIRVYKSSETTGETSDPPTPGPDEELVADIYRVNCDSIESAGILCGYANDTRINNCSVTGNIDIYSDKTSKWMIDDHHAFKAGMICGAGSQLTLNDISVDGTIKTETPYKVFIGGITGNIIETAEKTCSEISNCVSGVDIDVKSFGSSYAGGLLGRFKSRHNSGSLMELSEYADGSMITMKVEWYNSINSKPIADNINNIAIAGGICGRNDAVVTNCRAGNISVNVDSDLGGSAGGVCGFNRARISECISNAVVNMVARGSYGWAGGICSNNGINYTDSIAPSDIENIIENCTYERPEGAPSISLQSADIGDIGYIAGENRAPAEIRGCTVNAGNMSFYSPRSIYAGGICGYANGGRISQCITEGSINSRSGKSVYCGGIIGASTGQTYTQYTDKTNTDTVGHLVGVDVSDCINNMDIAIGGTSMYAGGLVGYLNSSKIYEDHQSSLKTSFSTGDISIAPNSTSFAGGAVGYLVDSTVDDCYSTGNVTVGNTTKLVYAGGFVSRIKQSSIATTDVLAKVTNCYSSGSVATGEQASKVNVGSFTYELSDNSGQLNTAGSTENPTAPLLNNCYYYSDEEPAGNAIGNRLTSAEASDSSKYIGWSFGTDWNVEKSSGFHQNIWYTDESGAHLAFEKPGAYACTAQTENGIDARITSISLSQPQYITSVKVMTTDILGMEAEIPVELPPERSALFMNMPCNIELDPLTSSYRIVNEYTIAAPVEASLILGDTAQAKVKNNTESAVEAYIAEYSEAGDLIDICSSTVNVGRTKVFSADISSNAKNVKLFVWSQNMAPLADVLTENVQ